MAKTLRQFKELYEPKAADEKKFVDKHVVKKHKDRNGNDDKLFQATNVKPVKRATEHGYETVGQHDDEKVYEETQVNEKMNLSKADMGDVIKDFQKSKAPQFKGKTKEQRRKMAIAAKLQSDDVSEEIKDVVDKSGAVHTPMSRARHLARTALKREMEKRAKEAASVVTKKETNEEVDQENIDYNEIKQYLLSVYEGRLDKEDQSVLNEMLETEEGVKLAFVITYFSGE
jgi:hypothetical protein